MQTRHEFVKGIEEERADLLDRLAALRPPFAADYPSFVEEVLAMGAEVRELSARERKDPPIPPPDKHPCGFCPLCNREIECHFGQGPDAKAVCPVGHTHLSTQVRKEPK